MKRLMMCVLLSACSSESPGMDAGADAGADVVETVDAAKEASVDSGCNGVTNIATAIPQTFVASDPVVGDGGALVPGMYVCTAAVVYTGADGGTGPTGLTIRDTVELDDAGAYERAFAFTNDAGLDSSTTQNGTITTNGGSLTVKQTCPSGLQPFNSFDSNGTVFHIYAPAAGAGNPAVMFEYTKQ